MKKLLLLALSAVTAALTVSCTNTPPEPPVGGSSYKFTTVSDAVYRGEKFGDGSGFYTFTLSDAEGNTLHIDCFGNVASNAVNPRFNTGEYKPGSIADHASRTFVTATSATDEYGTVFTQGDKAYPIDGGSMNVSTQGGSFSLNIEFTSGETTIKGTFEGSLKFEGKPEVSPRNPKPSPRPVSELFGAYYGKYNNNDATAGMFILQMGYLGNLETGANVEALQLQGFIPLQEDNENVILPVGTYTITTSTTATEPFTLLAGGIDIQNGYQGTYEFYTDATTSITKGYIISEGTMTVEKNGEDYKISANFKGKRSDSKSILMDTLEEVTYLYEGPLTPLVNSADPITKLEGPKQLGEMKTKALLQVIPKAAGEYTAWLYYIFGEGVSYTLVDNTLDMTGTGDLMMLAIWGPAQSTDNPVGEFRMSPGYGLLYEKGSAMPGNPLLGTNIDPQQGCWYTHVVKQGSSLSIDNYAGAMPDQGRIITKPAEDGTNQIVDFLFYDKRGNEVSGVFEGPIEVVKANRSTASADAGFYVPSFPIAPEAAPATPFRVRFAN